MHGEAPRLSTSFYQLEKGKITLLKTFEKMAANRIFWSPQGQYVVVCGLASMGGTWMRLAFFSFLLAGK